jgi:hypothetical protein
MRPLTLLGTLAFVAAVFGQGNLNFEVASVKQWDSLSTTATAAVSGGPGTNDPERMTWWHRSLGDLVMYAYGVKAEQIVAPIGSPQQIITSRPDTTSSPTSRRAPRKIKCR